MPMNILASDYILTCNDDFTVLRNQAVCFDTHIQDIDTKENLLKKYPNATVQDFGKNSVIMPGLINPHVHLEFSANKTALAYGNFITWLQSVIAKRDDLSATCNEEMIGLELEKMQKNGTTTIGAISSFGGDFEACQNSKLRTVFFTEILGSRPDSVDVLFEDFKARLRKSEEAESSLFIPAISIHSAYSTHPILIKNVLDIAREQNYAVSTHLLESFAERQWLDDGSGDFYDFFSNFSPYARPLCSAKEYIELFKDCAALFTHCVHASHEELEAIKTVDGAITHCPVSNRLLGVGTLDIQRVQNTLKGFTLGTDGLSSNISLSLWDEMRFALMAHPDVPLNELANSLLRAVTKNSAKALKLNTGEVDKGKLADLIVTALPDTLSDEDSLALQLILHTKTSKATIIEGETL